MWVNSQLNKNLHLLKDKQLFTEKNPSLYYEFKMYKCKASDITQNTGGENESILARLIHFIRHGMI
jgi:hypothetical protein